MSAPVLSTSTDLDNRSKLRILIIECYWFYGRSHDLVRNRIREIFGRSAQQPTNRSIVELAKKFHDHGTIKDIKRPGRPKTATDDDSIETVREFFEENERYSLRKAGLLLNMSTTSVHRVLRQKIKSFPYKIQMHHRLEQFDMDRRDQFAFRMSSWIQRGKIDPNKIWFSDECHFWMDGYVNKQNYRFWATENPRVFNTMPLKSVKITVWCAISSLGVIGPFFFDETVNHERYRLMLEEEFIPTAQGLNAVDDFWFMQDGALPHRTQDVFEVLDEYFHGRVIGLNYESRYGCGIEWPPYSPDLNPCDYYLWGKLKDEVFRKRYRSTEELKTEISEQLRKIEPEELKRVIENFGKRLIEVQNQEGAHIEPYLH